MGGQASGLDEGNETMTQDSVDRQETSGWVGWAVFAGAILIAGGIFGAVQGFVAVLAPDTYFISPGGSLFLLDVSGWGWWNLILGLVQIAIGVCLLLGQTWARVVAIVLAILSATGQLLLIPVQPWWAMVIIAVDLLIIYALTAHGRELRR
jgi:hypothetical protein